MMEKGGRVMRPIKFRAVEGFPKYEVGEDGSVWSLNYNHTGKRKQLSTHLNKDGYAYVFFVVNRKRYKRLVHRLVALAFIPQPKGKHQVNHKNSTRNDNRLENLEWVTSQENTIHGWRNGRTVSVESLEAMSVKIRGANNPKAKLTTEDIKAIRSYREQGLLLKLIANKFQISTSQVSAICTRRNWNEAKI